MKLNKILVFVFLLFVAFSCFAEDWANKVDIHGGVSQGYLHSTGNNYIEDSMDGTFDFREYVLNMQIEPIESLRVGAQVLGREFGAVGNDELNLDWAVVDYSIENWIGIRAGQMRVPHGFYHESRDFDSLRTEILLPQGVYMEYMREFWGNIIGAGLYGEILTDDCGTFSYLVQYGDRRIDKDDGDMARLLSSSGTTIEDYDMANAVAGSLQWMTPYDGLRVGVTYSYMNYEIDGFQTTSFGASEVQLDVDNNFAVVGSIEYEKGPVTLASEYMETSHETLAMIPGSGMPTVDLSQDFSGYYFSGSYRFTDYLETALGYSRFDVGSDGPSFVDRGQPDYNNYQRDIYTSLRVDATDNLIFKLEYHWMTGSAGIFDFENPQGEAKHTELFAAKATFVF